MDASTAANADAAAMDAAAAAGCDGLDPAVAVARCNSNTGDSCTEYYPPTYSEGQISGICMRNFAAGACDRTNMQLLGTCAVKASDYATVHYGLDPSTPMNVCTGLGGTWCPAQ